MQEIGKIVTTTASEAVVPLACTAMAAIEDTWAAYSEQDIADLKSLIDLYKKYCGGKNKLACYSFDPSFNISLEEEKRPGFDPQLPIYFQFDDDKNRPFLYDDIQGKRYAPCKESQRWFDQIRPGHLSNGIAEAIGYVCEAQRIRDKDFLKRKYSYDPINMFCEELKAWLLQLSNIPLDNEQIISKIKARIDYLEAVRTRAGLFKEQGILVKVGIINQYSNTIRILAMHVKEIVETRLLPLAKEIYEHRSAREHFEKLCLTIESSIKEQVCFVFYILQDAKVSPNFLLQELAYPRVSSYEEIPTSVFSLLLKYLVCSDAFLMVFPHTQLQPKIHSFTVESVLPQPLHVLPHNICITPNFVNDFRNAQGSLIFPNLNSPTLDGLQLSDCNPKVADKKKINLGVLPIFKSAADMKTILEICAHIQMLCFCHVLSKEFFELAGEGGNLVTYRLVAKKLDPILEKFQHIFTEGLALIKKIKQSADTFYNSYFSPQKGKTSKRPEWASAWAEQNYIIASDTYKQYVAHQESIQENLKNMRQKIREISSPAYDQYLANKLLKLERLMQSFCQCYPDLQASPHRVDLLPVPALEPALEQKAEIAAAEEAEAKQSTPTQKRVFPHYGEPSAHRFLTFSPPCRRETLVACPDEILEELTKIEQMSIGDGGDTSLTLVMCEMYNEQYEDDRLKIKYARALLAEGSVENRFKALTIINEVYTKNPLDIGICYLRVTILSRLGDFKPALKAADTLLDQLETLKITSRQAGNISAESQAREIEQQVLELKLRIKHQLEYAKHDSCGL